MESETILPCPFCGGECHAEQDGWDDDPWQVGCVAERDALRAQVVRLREALKAWQILHSRFRPVSAAYPMVAEEVAHLLDYTAATLAATEPAEEVRE